MDKKKVENIAYVILFIALFVLISDIVQWIAMEGYALVKGSTLETIQKALKAGRQGQLMAVSSVFSSLITIAFFHVVGWAKLSRGYLNTRPWAVLFWTVCLSLGLILPSEWLLEQLQLHMPNSQMRIFDAIMKEPWGYVAVGLFVPIAEEQVFRGAILSRLLSMFGSRKHWWAILVSALIFGVIHFNWAQGLHAFVIGLVLGWLYYRTGSILPGVAFHWVNNTVAYIMYHVMPQMNDGKLIDLFHGDAKTMYMGLAFSCCIFLPALFQLYQRAVKKQ